MKDVSASTRILTINGGSSSIKFALFEPANAMHRALAGSIEGIGFSQGHLTVKNFGEKEGASHKVTVPDYKSAVKVLMDWIHAEIKFESLAAVGHRIVHGGSKYWEPQRITPTMLHELKHLSPVDPEHLPEEILLAEAFQRRFPKLPQIACFDTAFHHDMPRVAQLLPMPRRYNAKGIRRYGFHGLSCTYLIEELARIAGNNAAQGRVIVAHLGNGASVTAVRKGKSIDTSMSFTPTAGLPMSTRSGDLDPSLAGYLARTEQMTLKQFQHMINHESGLLGISEISSDMRELRTREKDDIRAAEAVEYFCYQTRKWICAFTGALGGLDTLIFAGGIGENSPEIRARICQGLDFIGLKLDDKSNHVSSQMISSANSSVAVRVIRTDEELVIARLVHDVLKNGAGNKNINS